MNKDLQYHDRREIQERVAAVAAPDDAVREVHLELADRHATKAWLIREGGNEAAND